MVEKKANQKYLELLQRKSKHSAPAGGTIEWFFHHDDHETVVHCEGSETNPYRLKHVGKKHVINKEYARGHGVKVIPTWFKFTGKISVGWWDLSSGKEIDVSEVPDSFK